MVAEREGSSTGTPSLVGWTMDAAARVPAPQATSLCWVQTWGNRQGPQSLRVGGAHLGHALGAPELVDELIQGVHGQLPAQRPHLSQQVLLQLLHALQNAGAVRVPLQGAQGPCGAGGSGGYQPAPPPITPLAAVDEGAPRGWGTAGAGVQRPLFPKWLARARSASDQQRSPGSSPSPSPRSESGKRQAAGLTTVVGWQPDGVQDDHVVVQHGLGGGMGVAVRAGV